jgi:hypothetical protein
MGIEALAGTVLILGFAFWMLAMILSPPNLYREPDLHKRAAIIERHLRRWYISQVCFGLGMLGIGLGFLLLAPSEIAAAAPWAGYIAGLALLIAGAIGAAAVYRQTFDPVGFWSGPNSVAERVAGVGLLVLTMGGLAVWGLLFIGGFQPAWIGTLMTASAILCSVIYAATRGGGAFFLISFAYLVSLVAGLALVGIVA